MSNGLATFNERSAHPQAPAAGKIKWYILNDGVNPVEPFYMLSDGIPVPFVGDIGPQGPQGPAGNDGADGADGVDGADGADGAQGPQGIQGPAGPMVVEALINEPATVTLPDSTVKSVVYSDTVTMSGAGECFLLVGLSVRPHSASVDYEYDLEVNGLIVQPELVEEGKDNSAVQSNWRTYPIPLGLLPNTPFNIDLRFSKESTGGVAQLKNYTAILVRYS